MSEVASSDSRPMRRASFSQRRLWFLHQLDVSSPQYNMPYAWRLEGDLDHISLQRALEWVVSRHESLRTVFEFSRGELYQRVLADPQIEFRTAEHDGYAGADELVNGFGLEPFDLATELPIRALLLKCGEHDHVLAINTHHVASDGWSVGLFCGELSECYNKLSCDQTPDLAPLECQFGDYSDEQHLAAEKGDFEKEFAYWRKCLDGFEQLNLPFDGAAGAAGSTHTAEFKLSAEARAQTDSIVSTERASHFMVHLAIAVCLLARYTSQTDICVGTVTAGRTSRKYEQLIGFFVNTLVLRTDLSGNPVFRDVISRVRDTALGAYMHQELPFDQLVDELKPARGGAEMPFFRVMFTYEQFGNSVLALNKLRTTHLPPGKVPAKFDLLIRVRADNDDVRVILGFREGLLETWRVESVVEQYRALLCHCLAQPDTPLSEIRLATTETTSRLLAASSGRGRRYDASEDIPAAFARTVSEMPDAVALISGDRSYTYSELNQQSDSLAGAIAGAGVKKGDRVAVCLGRSVDYVEAVLAILKLGACYVPIDSSYPDARIHYMLRDCSARVAIVNEEGPALPETVSAVHIHGAADSSASQPVMRTATDPGALAYINYTSGSTGNPKGVEIEHQSVVSLVCSGDYVEFGPGCVQLMIAPVSFDASTFELWGALLNGGCVAIYEPALVDLTALENCLKENEVTTVFLTTSLFNEIVDLRPQVLGHVRQLLTGGEAQSLPHIRKALAALPDTQIINAYGPTECTTFACTWPIPANLPADMLRVPIGLPVANTRLAVLDPGGTLCPPGLPGELHIGGAGLARGYVDAVAQTDERFVQLNIDDAAGRFYRTGDRVVWREDGSLEFLGRYDTQVKIRGHRIEPEEVEAVAASCPAVARCAVVVENDVNEMPQLVAYLTGHGDKRVAEELGAYLAERLPQYMLPSTVHQLDRMPLSPAGKIDRARLHEFVNAVPRGEIQTPDSALEKQLLGIWQEVLGREHIGVTDNFFEIGGNSLLAVRLVAETERGLGRPIYLADLFADPTIRALATRLASATARAQFKQLVPLRVVPGSLPLFCIHVRAIADHLADEQAVYWLDHLQSDDLPAEGRVEGVAAAYIREIRQVQAHGPYSLCGFSFGGMVAYEIARQLLASGEQVAFVGLLDATPPRTVSARSIDDDAPIDKTEAETETETETEIAIPKTAYPLRLRILVAFHRRVKIVRMRTGIFWSRLFGKPLRPAQRLFLHVQVFDESASRYRYEPIDCEVDLFVTAEPGAKQQSLIELWRQLLGRHLKVRKVKGTEWHLDLIREPHVRTLAGDMQSVLDERFGKTRRNA